METSNSITADIDSSTTNQAAGGVREGRSGRFPSFAHPFRKFFKDSKNRRSSKNQNSTAAPAFVHTKPSCSSTSFDSHSAAATDTHNNNNNNNSSTREPLPTSQSTHESLTSSTPIHNNNNSDPKSTGSGLIARLRPKSRSLKATNQSGKKRRDKEGTKSLSSSKSPHHHQVSPRCQLPPGHTLRTDFQPVSTMTEPNGRAQTGRLGGGGSRKLTPRSNSADGTSTSHSQRGCNTDLKGGPGGSSSSSKVRGYQMPRSSTYAGASSLNSKLTPPQKRALQTTWKHMSQNGGINIMERIFQKLINGRPKVKDVFYKAAFVQLFSRYGGQKGGSITTLHDHGRIMAKLFDDIINNLTTSESIMADIMSMGEFKTYPNSRAEVWESFGESALEIIAGQESVKSSVDAVRAWTLLVACVTDELRYGFEEECRETEKSKRLSISRQKERQYKARLLKSSDVKRSGIKDHHHQRSSSSDNHNDNFQYQFHQQGQDQDHQHPHHQRYQRQNTYPYEDYPSYPSAAVVVEDDGDQDNNLDESSLNVLRASERQKMIQRKPSGVPASEKRRSDDCITSTTTCPFNTLFDKYSTTTEHPYPGTNGADDLRLRLFDSPANSSSNDPNCNTTKGDDTAGCSSDSARYLMLLQASASLNNSARSAGSSSSKDDSALLDSQKRQRDDNNLRSSRSNQHRRRKVMEPNPDPVLPTNFGIDGGGAPAMILRDRPLSASLNISRSTTNSAIGADRGNPPWNYAAGGADRNKNVRGLAGRNIEAYLGNFSGGQHGPLPTRRSPSSGDLNSMIAESLKSGYKVDPPTTRTQEFSGMVASLATPLRRASAISNGTASNNYHIYDGRPFVRGRPSSTIGPLNSSSGENVPVKSGVDHQENFIMTATATFNDGDRTTSGDGPVVNISQDHGVTVLFGGEGHGSTNRNNRGLDRNNAGMVPSNLIVLNRSPSSSFPPPHKKSISIVAAIASSDQTKKDNKMSMSYNHQLNNHQKDSRPFLDGKSMRDQQQQYCETQFETKHSSLSTITAMKQSTTTTVGQPLIMKMKAPQDFSTDPSSIEASPAATTTNSSSSARGASSTADVDTTTLNSSSPVNSSNISPSRIDRIEGAASSSFAAVPRQHQQQSTVVYPATPNETDPNQRKRPSKQPVSTVTIIHSQEKRGTLL